MSVDEQKARRLVRVTLGLSCPFNLLAAGLILLPASAPGAWLGLPPDVPLLYAALAAYLIAAFGLLYAWMASRPWPDRSLLAFASLAKAGVFVLALVLWLGGAAPPACLLGASGDLGLAALWSWWLLRSSGSAPA